MEEIILGNNQIVCGDSVEWSHKIPDESLDLCITSPPYKDSDGYTDLLMHIIFGHVYRILKKDSLFFLNFGHLAEDKFRPFRVCEIAMQEGFKLNETITWVKNHYRPIQGNKRMNNLSEFVFLLYKGNMPDLDRLSIGVPHVDKSNAKRFSGGRDLKCRGNVWHIPYETINAKEEKLHNDRFPLELPKCCIKLARLPFNATVFDPFSGSGTTCVAAKQLGFNYLGIEKNKIHYATSILRLNNLDKTSTPCKDTL